MKNLSTIFILLSFCIVFFSGCKKEEELSTREKLVGMWKYETAIFNVYDENGDFKETINRNFTTIFREIKSDGTYDITNTSSINPDSGDDGTWELIDNDTKIQMILKGGFDIQIDEEITELTDKKLAVYYELESTEPGVSKIQYTFTYSKE
jgi:hypothetical protein